MGRVMAPGDNSHWCLARVFQIRQPNCSAVAFASSILLRRHLRAIQIQTRRAGLGRLPSCTSKMFRNWSSTRLHHHHMRTSSQSLHVSTWPYQLMGRGTATSKARTSRRGDAWDTWTHQLTRQRTNWQYDFALLRPTAPTRSFGIISRPSRLEKQ